MIYDEPANFLMVACSSKYNIYSTFKSGSWGSFETVTNKDLISKSFLVHTGNKNSILPSYTYNSPNFENIYYFNWKLVEKEPNSNKFVLVSDIPDLNNCLTFYNTNVNFGWGWSFGSNDSYQPNLASMVDALTFEIDYYSTVSNNTYLIFTTFIINNVKVKYYLTKTEFSVQLSSYIVNGSIWGFNKAF
ncbi:MAG: hypothetical protein ACOVP1_11695 [Bacteroidia bacterium]